MMTLARRTLGGLGRIIDMMWNGPEPRSITLRPIWNTGWGPCPEIDLLAEPAGPEGARRQAEQLRDVANQMLEHLDGAARGADE